MTRIVFLFVALFLLSCVRGRDDGSVPRETAWPRVDMPDSVYSSISAGDLRLMVNTGAKVDLSEVGEGWWVTISYGGFASPTVYITLTECGPEEIEAVLANRLERRRLNLGSDSYELTELSLRDGWEASMAVSRGSMTTPVQILAHDDRSVLSGVLMLSVVDSLSHEPVVVAPIVDAVERDVLVMLKNLDVE